MCSPISCRFFFILSVILLTALAHVMGTLIAPWRSNGDTFNYVKANDFKQAASNSLPKIQLYTSRRTWTDRQSDSVSKTPIAKGSQSILDESKQEETTESSGVYSEQSSDKVKSSHLRPASIQPNGDASESESDRKPDKHTSIAKERPLLASQDSLPRVLDPSEVEAVKEKAFRLANEEGFRGNSQSSMPPVSRCPTCERVNRDKLYRIDSLKKQILKGTRMTKLPNTTGIPRPKIPSIVHLMDQDAEMMNDEPKEKRGSGRNNFDGSQDDDDDITVVTERVFMVAKQSPIAESLNVTDTLYFSPHIQLYTSKIKTAYLWFFIRKGDKNSGRVSLTVELILPESRSINKPVLKTILSQSFLRNKASGWKRIDLRGPLRRWLRHPMGNYGLVIKALDTRGNNLIVLPPCEDNFKGYEPWLETRIVEGKSNSRHRRSESLRCNENTTETRCCRYPLTLSFRDFGWDWIIAPLFVRADQCSGDCMMSLSSSPYSWMAQQSSEGEHTPCCVPTKQASLALLYFDENKNVVYQILDDIKVEKCGCR